MTTFCWKKLFYDYVGHVFVSHLVLFFAYCILHGNLFPDGCDEFLIWSTNWFLQTSLDFRKWVIYKNFLSKGTKTLVNLPWPSRKQSSIFNSSSSNLVPLTCSILLAKTDLLASVNLVFWKELNTCFFFIFCLESLLRNAGYSVHSPVWVVEMNCTLHIIEELSTLDSNVTPESVLEKCIQTVHMLIVETECIQFL